MTINPPASHPLTVTPVVDYEPPPGAVQHRRPCSPTRRRSARPPQRPAAVLSPGLRAAGAFADAALRRVLEVIDRRRPLAQLRPLLAPRLADSLSVRSARTEHGGAATLRRVRVQPVGVDDPPTAVEAFGTYTRGRRTHAIACKVCRAERAPADTETRWQVVALHIG